LSRGVILKIRPEVSKEGIEGKYRRTVSKGKKAQGIKEYLMPFWVYILRCSDGSYYTGQTENLEKRIAEHQTGEIHGYTTTRRPVEVIFYETFPTRDEAFAAERRIKGWSRKKKEAMMRGDWKEVQRLAWGKRNPLPDHLR
jgi:predicted GIY-YIG superfamily endonuclease